MRIWTASAAGDIRFTKKYWLQPDGSIRSEQYPHIQRVTSYEHEVDSLKEFYEVIAETSRLGHALVKGKLNRRLVDERRAGATDSTDTTEWICLDFDGLVLGGGTPAVDDVLTKLGLGDYSYVVQYSSSAGLPGSVGLRAHVFMLLAGELAPLTLKAWLENQNYTSVYLSEGVTLAASRAALRFPLDITTCQNDKFLYVAAPELHGLDDPYPGDFRVQMVRKGKDRLPLTLFMVDTQLVGETRRKRIDSLRKAQGLGKLKGQLSYLPSGEELLTKLPAGSMVKTGEKHERGFTYLNLNGGDSWGYYHPDEDCTYLYNFKGEPVYLIKEVLPEYHQAWEQARQSKMMEEGNDVPYVVLDGNGKFLYGLLHIERGVQCIYKTTQLSQVEMFFAQYGMTIPGVIPTCEPAYDPTANKVLDVDNRLLNRFIPSDYMRGALVAPLQSPRAAGLQLVQDEATSWIGRLINHVMSGDAECVAYFMNWVAHIFQNRTKANTAWLLTGTQGTGKSALFQYVLTPLLGDTNTRLIELDTLNEKFNAFQESSLLVMVDEVDIRNHPAKLQLKHRIKGMITNAKISVRSMQRDSRDARSWNSFIFTSNEMFPLELEDGDRRFHIPAYQTQKINPQWVDPDMFLKELRAFATLLGSVVIDEKMLNFPIMTEQRSNTLDMTQHSSHQLNNWTRDGELFKVASFLPPSNSTPSILQAKAAREVAAMVRRLHVEANPIERVSTEELAAVYELVTGRRPDTMYRMTKMLKGYGFDVRSARIGTTRTQCVEYHPRELTDEEREIMTDHIKDW